MTADRPGWPTPTWPALMGFAALTRLAVLAAGLAVSQIPAPFAPTEADRATRSRFGYHYDRVRAESFAWVEPWYRWDAVWYAEVSVSGYWYDPDGQSAAGFMPLLPVCMAAGAAVGVDRYLTGLLVANAAFVVGLACFGRVVLALTGRADKAWWGCVLLVTFPFAFFFSAPYHESLYLALSAGAVLAWVNRRTALAAALVFAAATSRLTAVALVAGLLLEYAADVWRGRRPRHGVWLVVAAAAGGVAAFFGYLYAAFGDPMVHLKAHAHWGRSPPSLGGFARSLRRLGDTHDLATVGPQVVLLGGCLVLGVLGWVRRGPLWGSLAVVPVLQTVSTGTLGSLQRVVLSAYPAAAEAADVPYTKYLRWAWVGVGVPAQVWLLHRYMHNGFVG